MGRFLAGVGLATVFAWFFRRRRKPKPQPAPPQPDPADELKQKLAESRTEEAAPPPEPEAAQPAGIDERRRAVHARAQAAIDQMREPPPTG